ncbi:MAG: hypothetical protein V4724_17085 [Pseudomonadota bacterium]
MAHRDGIFATIALALSSVALAAMLYTDAYSVAAGTEAQGYTAFAHDVIGAEYVARADNINGALTAAAPQAVQ